MGEFGIIATWYASWRKSVFIAHIICCRMRRKGASLNPLFICSATSKSHTTSITFLRPSHSLIMAQISLLASLRYGCSIATICLLFWIFRSAIRECKFSRRSAVLPSGVVLVSMVAMWCASHSERLQNMAVLCNALIVRTRMNL